MNSNSRLPYRALLSTDWGAGQFVYDGDQLLYELDPYGNPSWMYGFGPAGLAQVGYAFDPGYQYRVFFDPEGNLVQRQQFLFDPSPTDVRTWDAFGVNTNRYVYNEFRAEEPVGFAGQWGCYTFTDDSSTWGDTGLVRMGYRYYDPYSARFVTRDPLSYDAGANLYTYCSGDPINNVDPLGLQGLELKNTTSATNTTVKTTTALQTEARAAGAQTTTKAGTIIAGGTTALMSTGESALVRGFCKFAARGGFTYVAVASVGIDVASTGYYELATDTAIARANVEEGRLPGLDNLGRKLESGQKRNIHLEACDLWEERTKRRAIWDSLYVHHDVPLEWAHLFCYGPNRPSSLVGVNGRVHKEIADIWRNFKKGLNGREPTASEVWRLSVTIRARYRSQMRFLQ